MIFDKIMLYDEQGRAYVERPLIPEEQNLMYIVKDYRRMYCNYGKLEAHVKKLADTNIRISNHNLALTRQNQEQRDVIRHCLKLMKKNGVEQTSFLSNYVKEHRL